MSSEEQSEQQVEREIKKAVSPRGAKAAGKRTVRISAGEYAATSSVQGRAAHLVDPFNFTVLSQALPDQHSHLDPDEFSDGYHKTADTFKNSAGAKKTPPATSSKIKGKAGAENQPPAKTTTPTSPNKSLKLHKAQCCRSSSNSIAQSPVATPTHEEPVSNPFEIEGLPAIPFGPATPTKTKEILGSADTDTKPDTRARNLCEQETPTQASEVCEEIGSQAHAKSRLDPEISAPQQKSPHGIGNRASTNRPTNPETAVPLNPTDESNQRKYSRLPEKKK
ncbi:hypothetical protein LTR66_007147 [Elasticomyces elasticus]|nr:hypothetical protein LTR66_007147 [Elasticomyces elasticus]KAK4993601.1 hypothetical protein LTR50_000211 [Elasticomyces elasticus]KAK5010329.1 hypothetical protein LTR28_010556 [Elasticomyces elasticus]